MKYIPTNSLKRPFSLKRRSFSEDPLSSAVSTGDENDESLNILQLTECPRRPIWKCFSYEGIFEATNGFNSENLVEKGWYVEVYRGTLENGEAIAVKRLTKTSSDERKGKEFLTEISTIGHVHHPNVSSLLGCCIDNGLYLVFQFSSKGSVTFLLHGNEMSEPCNRESKDEEEGDSSCSRESRDELE